MTIHRHRSAVERTGGYYGCRLAYIDHDERAHGGVVFTQACFCGALRLIEANGGVRVRGEWDERFSVTPSPTAVLGWA